MIYIYYTIINIFNTIIFFCIENVIFSKSKFYFTRIKLVGNQNRIGFVGVKVFKCIINIRGVKNELAIQADHLTNCNISITGSNNKLIIDGGVGISNGNIIIRGNNCIIRIGAKTTFGGVRIVNVGNNNNITIGENCLFSDKIEIWASDTHSIFNKDGEIINEEMPIIIEDNVWIGSNVTILKGVKVGKGSIIGIASVVTKDIYPKTINVGNPTKCVSSDIKWTLKYDD